MGNLFHWAVVLAVLTVLYGLLVFGGLAGHAEPAATLVFWSLLAGCIFVFLGRLLQRT